MLKTIFPPDTLSYPVVVAKINVREGQAIQKGDLVVQLFDSAGQMVSVDAPFDCVVSALNVQYGQQLFEPSKIAWLHADAKAREEPLKVNPKPAATASSRRATGRKASPKAPKASPDPSKRYYHSAKGAWHLRIASWLGFLALFLFALKVISFDPDLLEVFGEGPIRVFTIATLALLLVGLMGTGVGIAVAEQFSDAAKREAEAREAVTQRIRNGEDVKLPKDFALPLVLAVTLPLVAAFAQTADLDALGDWYDDGPGQVAHSYTPSSSSKESLSTSSKKQHPSASPSDLEALLAANAGSGEQVKRVAARVLGPPLDICYEIWAPVSAKQMDAIESCPGCPGTPQTMRQSFIKRWQGFRNEELMLSINRDRPLNYLRYIEGLANLECADLPLHRCDSAVGGCTYVPHYAMILSYQVYDLSDNPCQYASPLGHYDLSREKQTYLTRHSSCRPHPDQSWMTGTIPIE